MSVYKLTKLAGASATSYADATRTAMERAQKTLRNVEWWEVKEMRGAMRDGKLEYQVELEIGFRLDD
ncbi:MAG TPA: dodecin [Chloroflexota bacterium]|nr:dodecin [Chloroflexota bacterium]